VPIVYHLLVLLSMKDMELSDLEAELEARRAAPQSIVAPPLAFVAPSHTVTAACIRREHLEPAGQ